MSSKATPPQTSAALPPQEFNADRPARGLVSGLTELASASAPASVQSALLVLARSLGRNEARHQINYARRKGLVHLPSLCLTAMLLIEYWLIAAFTYYALVLIRGG